MDCGLDWTLLLVVNVMSKISHLVHLDSARVFTLSPTPDNFGMLLVACPQDVTNEQLGPLHPGTVWVFKSNQS